MGSVDKLREALGDCITKAGYKDKFDTYWITKDAADKLIDEIEAEIAEYYTKLPVDADGVPVRVGDKIEHRGHTGDVWLFGANEIMCTDRVCYPIGECHLVKPRTLEDVLHDVMQFGHDDNTVGERADGVIAKYADEIRELLDKAGD